MELATRMIYYILHCLEFVEAWWPYRGLEVVHRQTGRKAIISHRSSSGEYDGLWKVDFIQPELGKTWVDA
eukprot:6647610-Prymnesium_polylepis.1